MGESLAELDRVGPVGLRVPLCISDIADPLSECNILARWVGLSVSYIISVSTSSIFLLLKAVDTNDITG